MRQHLTEVLVLATAGAGIGILLSIFGMRWFTQALSVNPPPFWITFELDYRVMLFVLGLIVLASAVRRGAAGAARGAGRARAAVLKDDSRSSTSASLGRFSSGLVVAELAVSCGLLIAAGLMIKSVVQLKNVQMPFAIENMLTARIDLPRDRYPDSPASIRFFEQLLPRLQAVPGVEAATLSDGLPAAGNGSITVQIEGKAYPQASDYPLAREGIVTAGYFDTFQTKLLSGREFTPADAATSQPVAIVNESFARVHFPNVDPVGHQMKRIRPASKEPWLTIVGVVPDLIMEGIGNNNASPVGYYIPIAQSDVANGVRIAVRTRGEPAALTSLVAIRGDVARQRPRDLRDRHACGASSTARRWFYTVFGTFFMAFGLCALFLAAAGLYGVMSFAVTQRTREMGVRSALGAQGAQLILLVMRKSVVQLAIGLVARPGACAGSPPARCSRCCTTSIRATSPSSSSSRSRWRLASLVASFLPARRVTRIDPVIALATE